jgi:glycosyltransferase involved in cell wall biosynthesis
MRAGCGPIYRSDTTCAVKVAIVHDWLVRYRGGEKVLEAICELYPEADLFTLIHEPGTVPAIIERRSLRTSFLQSLPGATRRYRNFLPLFPRAIESFDLRGYDLVISSSHSVAKGAQKPGGARHLSYVHAPMRYVWDRFDDYFGAGRARLTTRIAARAIRPWLQHWDRRSATGVDRFVANSHYIAEKVARIYGRQASVVHPFVEVPPGAPSAGRGDYFLWVGAAAPYKRLDLAIDAFAALKLPLWVAGFEVARPRGLASVPANVRLLGEVDGSDLASLYGGARAVVFTAEEDFGIVPLEAQAAGRPVIAYAAGGALETVNSRTGLFFFPQTPAALQGAVQRFEEWERSFIPSDARTNAARFSKAEFQRRFAAEVRALMNG